MRIEDLIRIEENEKKPNRNSSRLALWSMLAAVIVLSLNLFGVFRVDGFQMGLGVGGLLLCSLIIHVLGIVPETATSGKTKYVIISLILIEALIACLFLGQWAELLIVYPLIVAIQYHRRSVTVISVVGALVIALISAPLSLALGLFQPDFYSFLLKATGYQIDFGSLPKDPNYDLTLYLGKVFTYLSIPRTMIIGVLGALAIATSRLISNNVEDRVKANYYMSTDILTGLPNRFSYEQKCKDINSKRPIALIVAYIDVDGLHALNDERGHMAGDLMLKYFAEKLGQAFGELNVYRIGGDEFVGFIPSTDEQGALAALSAINEQTTEDGYHLSFGVAVYKEFKLIESVIREAEGKMYTAKSEYYASSGKDRRKQ